MNHIAGAKLAHTLQKRMKQVNNNDSVTYTDFGVITGNNGLKLDNFEPVIPSGDYTVCTGAGQLSPDDRVLVVWCNGEPVVVDTIVLGG